MTARNLTIVSACFTYWAAGQADALAQPADAGDQDSVYRAQPIIEDADLVLEGAALVLVAPAEIQPGLVYNYYNEWLGRRAWGLAQEGGSFRYVFGERTMMPLDRFDLRLTPEQEQTLLEERSPDLRDRLEVTGASPSVVLTPDEHWRLLPFHVDERVFDVETGHRWEWHGRLRTAVVHTYGDQWQIVDGRFVPLGGGVQSVVVSTGCVPAPRVGSVAYLVRTAE